nr:unnamed protein product [Spirometra erinaceieuropaei]
MLQFIKSQFGLDFSLATAEAEKANRVRPHQQNDTFSQPTDVDNSMELAGNPLALQEICNLTMADADITSDAEHAASTLIDYTSLMAIRPEDFLSQLPSYDMNTLFALDEGGTMTAFGVTDGLSAIERRIIRIRTDRNPDLELNHADLLKMNMPFSEAVDVSFEASYSFGCSEYRLKFDRPVVDRPLAPPPDATVGSLELEFSPYSPIRTPLPSIRVEMERVKRLCLAYRDETPWIPVADRVARSRAEISAALSASLSRENSPLTAGTSDVQKAFIFRTLDTTERIWEAIKDVPDRRSARLGMECAIAQLGEDVLQISLDENNSTQLAGTLRGLINCGAVSSSLPLLGLEFLCEIGLFKVANDCISIINSVWPKFQQTYPVERIYGLREMMMRLKHLHHLYKTACLSALLTNVIQSAVAAEEIRAFFDDFAHSEAEWTSLMETDRLDLDFPCRRECRFPVSALRTKLTHLAPRLWIVKLSALDPMRIEKRIVYELIRTPGGGGYYYGHVVELVDTLWLYPN